MRGADRVRTGASLARVSVVAAFVLLVGCDAGGGGGVGLSGGQDPDPVIVDYPIAYVKRPVPDEDTDGDLRELNTFEIGADLYVKDRASPSAVERNITGALTQGLYDVRDLEMSYAGDKVIFAMRGPFDENLDEDEQPTWNIWEYDIVNDALRRVVSSDITAEAGQDVAPHYLPDGRIVFSSTRQRISKAILLDESKPQFEAQDEDRNESAFVLHVMNADGSDIRQISFNQSHDLDPTVLSNGQIMFSRWDNAGGGPNAIHLYRANPDGTDLELLYGANSHATGSNGSIVQFVQPRELENGNVVVLLKPFGDTDFGGDIAEIDVTNYLENTQANAPNAGVLGGPAQQKVVVNDVRTDELISPGGRYAAAYPLYDGTGRMFVSWSQCRLQEVGAVDPDADPPPPPPPVFACTEERLSDPTYEAAPPAYGLWIYNRSDDTQLPVVPAEQGVMITDVVAASPRPLPPVILDKVAGLDLDPDLVRENVGVLHIRSVYDIDGVAVADIGALADPAVTTADERPLRFVRVEKAVSMPDEDVYDFDNSAFGVSAAFGMREIVAYGQVEPDGSVMVKVPANVALAVSLLDVNGKRVGPRHTNWLQVRPGQVLECSGCHDPGSGWSHGRADAFVSINPGAQTSGVPFPNTDPAIFADFGETMAEARMRVSCANDNCAALAGTLDITYDDVWTDETAAGRLRDASFAYRYADLGTPPPTSTNCILDWDASCRSTINYEEHLHPLWSLPRQILDVDGVTVLADNTCTLCHNPTDAMGNPQVPAGQLDLTDGASDLNMDHFKSYRELVSGDNAQELVNGVLQDIQVVVGTDPVTGDPILAPVGVAPSMSIGGAQFSDIFFSRFEAAGSHDGYLSQAELKLLAEWLDIGGQYYNNPFAAPEN